MIKKIFRTNKKEHINIWVRKSAIKFDKKKSILIEVVMPGKQFFIFKDRNYFRPLQINPVPVLELLKENSNEVKEQVKKDGFFYYNGQKIDVKELL